MLFNKSSHTTNVSHLPLVLGACRQFPICPAVGQAAGTIPSRHQAFSTQQRRRTERTHPGGRSGMTLTAYTGADWSGRMSLPDRCRVSAGEHEQTAKQTHFKQHSRYQCHIDRRRTQTPHHVYRLPAPSYHGVVPTLSQSVIHKNCEPTNFCSRKLSSMSTVGILMTNVPTRDVGGMLQFN